VKKIIWHANFNRPRLETATMKRLLCTAAFLLAAIPCPAQSFGTNPPGHAWIVSPCENWNCASAALVMANGSAKVMALPTSSSRYPWIVLRRIEAGSVYLSPDRPFDAEPFVSLEIASARFASLEAARAPMLITSAEGEFIVISLRQPESRRPATAH
jgi:hypothetical protein